MTELTGKAYGASVLIGTACCKAFSDGATHEDVIEALEHSVTIGQRNRALGIPEADLAIE